MKPRNCYVYAIKVSGIIRIIGKGSNGRVDNYLAAMRAYDRGTRKPRGIIGRKLYAAYKRGAKIEPVILVNGLSHTGAFKREKLMIADYRARFPGRLWNIMPGGAGFNPSKYTPEGLAAIKALARKASRAFWDNATPKMRAKIRANQSAGLLDFYSDPERRAAFRAEMQKHYRRLCADPKWYAELCARAKRIHSDPAVRAKQRASFMRTLAADPELRARRIALQKIAMADPAVRRRFSIARKRYWANPKSHAHSCRMIAAAMTPEVRKRAGATHSKTLMTDGPARTRHLALIARLAADKDMQRRKGRKLSRTLRDNPEMCRERVAKWFYTPEHQRRFRKRLKALHSNKALQRRRLASVRRALNDPVKDARRKAGLARFWDDVRAGRRPHPASGR